MAARTLLDELRSCSQVDCDSLDVEVASKLAPFVDCTSNQAIVYLELQKPANEAIIHEGIKLAQQLHPDYGNELPIEQLAADILTVMLASRITQYITGRALVQVNPYHAYSSTKITSNAKRLIALFKQISPTFPSSRVCIKIPSTWEGLQACRTLEQAGIRTLATTLFTMEQAALAADAGCTYIAPYVNELKVHFVPGYVDSDKGFALTRSAQRYYARIRATTQVMPASLASVAEVMRLAGANHITVSPPLLALLASTPSETAVAVAGEAPRWFAADEAADVDAARDYSAVLKDESAYRIALTRSKDGASEKKLVDAVNIFADFQDKIEEVVKRYLQSAV